MGRHTGGADQHAETVGPGVSGEVRGGGGGAVGAENVGLIGDAEGLKLLAGPLYNGPVRVASHNDCYFFHAILLKKIKMQIKKG